MKKIYKISLITFSFLLLTGCNNEKENTESENNIEDEISQLEEKIKALEEKVENLEEKFKESTAVKKEESNELENLEEEFTMDKISGYYTVDAPNEFGLFLDENYLIKTTDWDPEVYPIVDYEIDNNLITIHFLDIDFESQTKEEKTEIYTIYGEANNPTAIREGNPPTQEHAKFHYSNKTLIDVIENQIDFDLYN